MYRNCYQRGMLTILFSCGSNPLQIWETHCANGYISRFLDNDLKAMVLEIGGTNVSTTYIIAPKGKEVLGITMPFLVMIVKNLKKYFTFEICVVDETNTRRRFRVSNFQTKTQLFPMCTVMPIGLSDGWNQIQFNLAEFTQRAYQKQFVEVQKIKINANIRIRRIYFADRLVPDDELPAEYKLYFPIPGKPTFKSKKTQQKKEETGVAAPTAPEKKPAEAAQPPVETAQAPVEEAQPPVDAAEPVAEAAGPDAEAAPALEEVPEEKEAAAPEGAAPSEADTDITVEAGAEEVEEPGAPSEGVAEEEGANAAPGEADGAAPEVKEEAPENPEAAVEEAAPAEHEEAALEG